MKLSRYICCFFFLSVMSCKELVTFEVPQPAGKNSLAKIPARLHGEYYSLADSSTLIIDRNRIQTIYRDSLTSEAFIDTILDITRKDQIKRYKGYYFLNTQKGENSWDVQKLKYKKGVLSIGRIATEEEIAALEEITETTRDTAVTYVVNPNKEQFREFLKREGFNESDIYISK